PSGTPAGWHTRPDPGVVRAVGAVWDWQPVAEVVWYYEAGCGGLPYRPVAEVRQAECLPHPASYTVDPAWWRRRFRLRFRHWTTSATCCYQSPDRSTVGKVRAIGHSACRSSATGC